MNRFSIVDKRVYFFPIGAIFAAFQFIQAIEVSDYFSKGNLFYIYSGWCDWQSLIGLVQKNLESLESSAVKTVNDKKIKLVSREKP